MAEFYRDRRRPDRAMGIYESILQTNVGEGKQEMSMRQVAEIQKALADLYCDSGKNEEAVKLYEHTLDLINQDTVSEKQKNDSLAAIYSDLGNAQFSLKRLEDALVAYKQAAHYSRLYYGEKSVEHLTMLNNIAACHFVNKDDPESLKLASEIAKLGYSLAQKLGPQKTVLDLQQNLQSIMENLSDSH